MVRIETPFETPLSLLAGEGPRQTHAGTPPLPPFIDRSVLFRASSNKQSPISFSRRKQKAIKALYIHHGYGFRISRNGIKPIRCTCGENHAAESKVSAQTTQ